MRELLSRESEAKAVAESELSEARKQGVERGEREQQWTDREQQWTEKEQEWAERAAEQERGWKERETLLSRRDARVDSHESEAVKQIRTLTPMKTPARTLKSEFGRFAEGDGGTGGDDGGGGENNTSRSSVYLSPNKIR